MANYLRFRAACHVHSGPDRGEDVSSGEATSRTATSPKANFGSAVSQSTSDARSPPEEHAHNQDQAQDEQDRVDGQVGPLDPARYAQPFMMQRSVAG